MKYLSPTDLPELTRAADRAQAFLDKTLDDLERMPPTTIEFRLNALDKITDFIYRLAAVRKTLAALRASFERNTDGLRGLTAMIRNLHAQMGEIATTIRMPRPPADLDLGFKRFAPDWPPCEDELIPEPRLPHTAFQSQSDSGVSPLMDSPLNSEQTPPSIPSMQSIESISSNPSEKSDPSPQTHETPKTHSPESQPASLSTLDPNPLTLLMSRFPASITNPNHQLPAESNNPNDYAPLLDLDLVPHTRSISTLPLANPGVGDHLNTQLAHLTDTVVYLRNDILTENPNALSDLIPSQVEDEDDLETPSELDQESKSSLDPLRPSVKSVELPPNPRSP